jgi:hypothetical protein
LRSVQEAGRSTAAVPLPSARFQARGVRAADWRRHNASAFLPRSAVREINRRRWRATAQHTFVHSPDREADQAQEACFDGRRSCLRTVGGDSSFQKQSPNATGASGRCHLGRRSSALQASRVLKLGQWRCPVLYPERTWPDATSTNNHLILIACRHGQLAEAPWAPSGRPARSSIFAGRLSPENACVMAGLMHALCPYVHL